MCSSDLTIRNITPGTYHIFALNDVNRDYKFDQPGEDIAFLDSVIVPSFELTTRQDTTWKDSLTIDTIRTVGYTRFFPDNTVPAISNTGKTIAARIPFFRFSENMLDT